MKAITNIENYEIKTLKGVTVPFYTGNVCGHYEFSQYGLFDKVNNAWVSIGSVCKHTGNPIPTQYTKSTWLAVFNQGGGITPDKSLGFALVKTT